MNMEYLFNFLPEYDEDSPFGLDVQKDYELFIEQVKSIDASLDLEIIGKSFFYCVEKHKNVTRKSGYPYYTHPVQVALILLKEFTFHDTNSVVACLLHDTIEDVKEIDKDEISREFNEDIADIVDAVTKISHENLTREAGVSKDLIKGLTYRKLFIALVKDIRVILIKLADRLHNMRTLHYLSEKKQKEVA